jgi:hypothetical protein
VPALLIAKLIGAAAIAAGLFWIVDEIGDRREAKVYRRINQAIENVNVKIRASNSLEDKVAALAEAAREKALAEVQPSECKASPDQAKSLTRIR